MHPQMDEVSVPSDTCVPYLKGSDQAHPPGAGPSRAMSSMWPYQHSDEGNWSH